MNHVVSKYDICICNTISEAIQEFPNSQFVCYICEYAGNLVEDGMWMKKLTTVVKKINKNTLEFCRLDEITGYKIFITLIKFIDIYKSYLEKIVELKVNKFEYVNLAKFELNCINEIYNMRQFLYIYTIYYDISYYIDEIYSYETYISLSEKLDMCIDSILSSKIFKSMNL